MRIEFAKLLKKSLKPFFIFNYLKMTSKKTTIWYVSSYLIVSFFLFLDANAQKMNCYEPDAVRTAETPIDDIHLLLDLNFKPEKGLVLGIATHTFKVIRQKVDSFSFTAPEIKFNSVKLDGVDLKYKLNKEGITFYPSKALVFGSEHKLVLNYEATPRRGIYFIGWNDTTNRCRKQIWTQGEGIDNRWWIPCFDETSDKILSEVIVHFDSKYKVLSNGVKLEEKKGKDGKTTWHYNMLHPHVSYLIMLGIGDYAIQTEKTKSGITLNNWYYPDMPNTLEPTYRFTGDMMDFLQTETGTPYPWGAYSQIPVQDFLYGAMENTSATIFGDFFCVDKRSYFDRNYIAVNAHEMAHQWFGDNVSAWNSSHQWLQESFATYYSKLYERHHFGEDYYRWACRNETNTALEMAKSNNLPIVNSSAGGGRIYQKGSFVLGMIEYVIGHENYMRAIKYYLAKHAYGCVDTHDLFLAFQESCGINLDWFFEEWLYRGGEPKYEVSYSKEAKNTRFIVKQTQEISDLVGYFKMPIVFEVHYKDGSMDSRKEWVQGASTVVDVANPSNKEIDFVLFEPNSEILKTVTFKKSNEELFSQALKAPNMIDKYDALLGLRDVSLSLKRKTLEDVFNKNTFQALRAEAISQLAADMNALNNSFIMSVVNDQNPNVKLSLLSAASTISESKLPLFEKLLADSSYKVVEAALIKLCDMFPDKTRRYLVMTDNLYGIGNSLRITWLKYAYSLDKTRITELVNLTTYSNEFRTRYTAFQALQSLNYLDNTCIASLFDALCSWNSRLRGPASDVMNYFLNQAEMKRKIKDYYNSKTWEDWQKPLLANYVK